MSLQPLGPYMKGKNSGKSVCGRIHFLKTYLVTFNIYIKKKKQQQTNKGVN